MSFTLEAKEDSPDISEAAVSTGGGGRDPSYLVEQQASDKTGLQLILIWQASLYTFSFPGQGV